MDQEERHFHHERERESPIHPKGNLSGVAIAFPRILSVARKKKVREKTRCPSTGCQLET